MAGLLIAAIVRTPGRRDLIAPAWQPGHPGRRRRPSPTGSRARWTGPGFIAAFVAGIVFRLALRRDPEELNRLTEEVGAVLNGVTFVLFGAVLLGPALTELSWQLVALRGAQPHAGADDPGRDRDVGLARPRVRRSGFLGWFGPRGLASIVFAVIVVEESDCRTST